MDAVKKYQKRRDSRLKKRGYRLDEGEEGEWRTTDNGHKILIQGGAVVGGNLFAIASMGEPEGAEMPKTAKVSDSKRVDSFVRNRGNRDQLADALKGHSGNCIFGGFYKVEDDAKDSLSTFYNPYTGESFSVATGHAYHGPWGVEEDNYEADDEFGSILRKMPQNQDATKLYNKSRGIIAKGDTVQVVGGKTLEHGMRAKVNGVYEGKYGKYVYLDNGEKIQAKHLSIVDEDGSLIRSFEGKESDGSKDRKPVEDKKTRKPTEVVQAEVESVVGSAKTRSAVVGALKKAGYTVQDNTDDSGSSVDVRVMRPDGTYVRIYKAGKELKFQDWKKQPEEKLKSDSDIKDAKYFTQMFANRHKDDGALRFQDLQRHEKYYYVLADSVNFFKRQGMDDKKAWSRAIENADSWDGKNYEGYGETKESEQDAKKVIGSIIEELKK